MRPGFAYEDHFKHLLLSYWSPYWRKNRCGAVKKRGGGKIDAAIKRREFAQKRSLSRLQKCSRAKSHMLINHQPDGFHKALNHSIQSDKLL
jgi:hypothetical protein